MKCILFLVEDSVWDDVLKMNDNIGVEYGKLEELFSQKVTSPTSSTLSPEPEDAKNVRTRRNSHKETEVRCNKINHENKPI